MATIHDFSNALMRCHGLYYLMAEGKEKTPKRKYEDLCALLVEEMAKYDAHILKIKIIQINFIILFVL